MILMKIRYPECGAASRRSFRAAERFCFYVWILVGFFWMRSSGAQSTWISQIERTIDGPEYQHANWGLLISDVDSGDVLYQRNAEKLFAPASTTKLYSVAAALDTLGQDYRFETPVYARGQTDTNGVLHGDLILVASGDLTLGGRTDHDGHIAFARTDHIYANGNDTAELTEPDPLAGLNDLAKQVASTGIKRVEGEVVIDQSLFESSEGSGSGPAQLTPIVINDNLVDVVISPGMPGGPASIDWRPQSAAVSVDVQVLTVASNEDLKITLNGASQRSITVRGQIPVGHKPLVRVSEVPDPGSFARTLLIEALRRAQVQVVASPFTRNRSELAPARATYPTPHRVALFRSPPFREEMKLILKISHNLHASTLPLLIAVSHGQRTLQEGFQIERAFLARGGVDVKSISFGSGAGGSRADYTTPQATVQLLRAMATRPDFDAYRSGLPILGMDGTLSEAVDAKSPARGRVTAKTGTLVFDDLLNGDLLVTSKALAGYISTSHNRKLAIAIYLNNVKLTNENNLARQGRVLAKLCEIMYEAL
jgi:serine-type D-Ala-D-Ala carboxypeptidase/endopeptidase (penicillin-binding protein 4)